MLSSYYKGVSFLYTILKNRGIHNSLYFKGRFKNSYYKILGRNNNISTKGFFLKSRITIQGNNNEVIIKSKSLNNCLFLITGNNNQIVIEEGVELNNSTLLVKGTKSFIHIGERTVANGIRAISSGNSNCIIIGADCLFADHIEIWNSDTHPIYNQNGDLLNMDKPIYIEEKVWIGAHSKILKGVTVGKGAIIGMGTTVVKNINPGTINIGVPSRQIKDQVSWNRYY